MQLRAKFAKLANEKKAVNIIPKVNGLTIYAFLNIPHFQSHSIIVIPEAILIGNPGSKVLETRSTIKEFGDDIFKAEDQG